MVFDGVGHAGVIRYVLADRVIFDDSNFIKCTPRTNVKIMNDDPHIRGYWFKNPSSPLTMIFNYYSGVFDSFVDSVVNAVQNAAPQLLGIVQTLPW